MMIQMNKNTLYGVHVGNEIQMKMVLDTFFKDYEGTWRTGDTEYFIHLTEDEFGDPNLYIGFEWCASDDTWNCYVGYHEGIQEFIPISKFCARKYVQKHLKKCIEQARGGDYTWLPGQKCGQLRIGEAGVLRPTMKIQPLMPIEYCFPEYKHGDKVIKAVDNDKLIKKGLWGIE